jgi:hypothetical protein
MFYSAKCSLLRAEGFSYSLDVLYGGLVIIKLLFSIKKEEQIPGVNFIHYLTIKAQDPEPDPKMLDPDPH